MEKSDSFRISPLYMSIAFSNKTQEHCVRNAEVDQDWNHYDIFRQVANLICGKCRFKPSANPYPELVVEDFPTLWKDHCWGENKYLRFQGQRYPAGFKFNFWYQDSRSGNSNGGAYDITPGAYATNLERLVFKNVARKVSAFLLSLGYEEACLEDGIKGRALVMWWRINEDKSRHWGKWEDYRNEPCHVSYNAKDRDEKIIENGQVKYFRGHDGRLYRGEVYHNINNMWWVVLNDSSYTNVANSDLFDPTPEDFSVRRIVKDRAKPEEKVRRKIGTKLYNQLKEQGIKMVLEAEK